MKFRIVTSILIFLICSSILSIAQEETTLVKLTEAVPNFEFEKSPGKITNISELKGKTVLITFFATWCGPMQKGTSYYSVRYIQQIQKKSEFRDNCFRTRTQLGRSHQI